MPSCFLTRSLLVWLTTFSITCICPFLLWAQGLQQTPYSAANAVRRGSSSGFPDLTPSNPLGLPGSSLQGPMGSDSIPISSSMFQGLLPSIPNLQLGYIYNFGQYVRAGRASVDYVLPVNLGPDATVYAETRAQFQSFWKNLSGPRNNRVDISLTLTRIDPPMLGKTDPSV